MWNRLFGAIAPVLSGLGIGLAAMPAWGAEAGEAPSPYPEVWFIYAVIIAIFIAALLAISLVRTAVAGTTWSLADALSEEAEVTAMTGTPPQPLLDANNQPVMVTEMRASISRLIALMGTLVLLLMFLGFGSFAMYRFAATGDMPAGTDDVVDFLLAGLTLFAPYLVNKFSSLFESLGTKR